jgi:hypothetical protein
MDGLELDVLDAEMNKENKLKWEERIGIFSDSLECI